MHSAAARMSAKDNSTKNWLYGREGERAVVILRICSQIQITVVYSWYMEPSGQNKTQTYRQKSHALVTQMYFVCRLVFSLKDECIQYLLRSFLCFDRCWLLHNSARLLPRYIISFKLDYYNPKNKIFKQKTNKSKFPNKKNVFFFQV